MIQITLLRCLLAVCTAEGRVKLYRPPYFDFCAEWIEVNHNFSFAFLSNLCITVAFSLSQIVDVSDLLYENLLSMNFGESNNPSTSLSKVTCIS